MAKKVPNAASSGGHAAARAGPLLRSEAMPYDKETMCISGRGVGQGAGAPARREARIWPERPIREPERGRGAWDRKGERGKRRTCRCGCGPLSPICGGMRRLRGRLDAVVDPCRRSHHPEISAEKTAKQR